MKKYLLTAAMIFGLASLAKADFFGGQDKLYHVHSNASIASTVSSTNTILIDLSDTTNYPHKETGELQISYVTISADHPAVSTGSIKLGVVNMVNVSSGSVTWFVNFDLEKSTATAFTRTYTIASPAFYRLRVNSQGQTDSGSTASGLTPYIISNDKTTESTAYQSDVVLTTVAGTNVAPAVGDIILQVNKEPTNSWNVDVEVFYNSKPR